jgi:arylsulfatase A-like enzyme
MNRSFIQLISVLLLLTACTSDIPSEKPNVVLIITDDQGYGDIAAHGNPVIETPNLDDLYRESIRFTNFHVDPTCSPTRAALMTGRYAHRVNVWHTIMSGNFLPEEEVTMAELFSQSGYKTAIFGKWHLGGSYPFRPIDQGFETWVGQGDGGTGTTTDYWFNDRVNDRYLVQGHWQSIPGYGPDVFFDKANQYIKSQEKDSPFFMYLSTYVPHNPLTLPDTTWVNKYRDKVPLKTAYYYASIERIDHNIGLLREALKEKGIDKNTILIFMTDNGGTYGINIFNAGMRGGKGTQYDGGHRVPFYVHWPARNLDEGKDIKNLTAHIDVLPTLIDLCNLKHPSVHMDGHSLEPLLFGDTAAWKPRNLVVEVQRERHLEKWTKSSVLTGNWRLVDGKELYHIKSDSGQQTDVSETFPDTLKKLAMMYDTYWKSVTKEPEKSKAAIVDSNYEEITELNAADWIPLNGSLTPWNQHHVSSGYRQEGRWEIRVDQPGDYIVEISRWPVESGLAINEAMKPKDTIDAYELDIGRKFSIYNVDNTHYEPLNIAGARLKIDSLSWDKPVQSSDQSISFNVKLRQGQHTVKADFLNGSGEIVTGAYYARVYK